MIEIQLNTKPLQSDLGFIEVWLKDEYDNTHDGFYCNWNIIKISFEQNKLFTFNYEGKPIVFISWSNCNYYIEVDIMEVHPKFRNKGFGKIAINSIAQYFKEQGKLALKLFCEPRDSERFWKNMGMIKFPIRGYYESDLTYYKPLIEFKSAHLNGLNCINKIELWNVEPYIKDSIAPIWTWEVELNGKVLKYPILHPCNPNWNIRWSSNGETVLEDKVKYFSRINPIDYSPFVFIRKLQEE